jgi:phenylacetate-coenzyme A ligase PaaK-like adenylate-forming protein
MKYNLGDLTSLSRIPILDRSDVRKQVLKEQSLVKPDVDHISVGWHETGGSSGNPLKFFITENNAKYNKIRGFSQYIIEGRNLSMDRVDSSICKEINADFGFRIITNDNWGGHFCHLGTGKSTTFIMYNNFNADRYLEKLQEVGVNGYFSSNPRSSRSISSALSSKTLTLSGLNIKVFLNRGDRISQEIASASKQEGIELKSTYSCEEIGPIGFSCPLDHEVYHVVTSNAFVESEKMPGMACKRLLITGLNSFATPLIRYDIGDIGEVHEGCTCGWVGQVISNLKGRRTGMVKLIGGGIRSCNLEASRFSEMQIDDIRIRQYKHSQVDVEYQRIKALSKDEENIIIQIIHKEISDEIQINFNKTKCIEWGAGYKKHFFRCEI